MLSFFTAGNVAQLISIATVRGNVTTEVNFSVTIKRANAKKLKIVNMCLLYCSNFIFIYFLVQSYQIHRKEQELEELLQIHLRSGNFQGLQA